MSIAIKHRQASVICFQIGREEPFLILTYIVRDGDQREPGDAEIKENGSRVVKTDEARERERERKNGLMVEKRNLQVKRGELG